MAEKELFSQLNKPAAAGFGKLQLLGFIVLAALLVGVLFVLPNMVEPPTDVEITRPEKAAEKTLAPAPPDSPWSDAQLAKQRREAQEILSEILTIQEKLEDRRIDLWADEAFKAAMATAAEGDELYRQREFSQAQGKYRDSLKQFETLEGRIEGEFNQRMADGAKAIEQRLVNKAVESYQLAVYLKPESIDAQSGLKRAEAQPEVLKLLKEGERLVSQGKATLAKAKFDQALELDPESTPANQQLKDVKNAIREENFANAMSEGFAALKQSRYDKAVAAFTKAGKIKPGTPAAEQALTQARNRRLLAQVGSHVDKAAAFEQQELWRQAEAEYQQAMKLDATVIKAKIGAIRAKARAELDEKLEKALAEPGRLTNGKVFAESRRLLGEAKKIQSPGERLSGQTRQLNQLLASLQKPIRVNLQSNNQTNVTLYRVGNLGNFTAKQVELKPGKYTLVGTRTGYRDVREEFTLLPGEQVPTIVVQCEEKING